MLQQGEPGPVEVINEAGASPFVLVCEHAGNRIPRALGALGLDSADLVKHIAWDIGAESVARHLSKLLDAVLAVQVYSRLVIDCNRPPASPGAMPAVSDRVPIPGNVRIGADERARRADAIFHPFHDRVAALLDARAAAGRRSILVTVHSFTSLYEGQRRPWHVGAQFNRYADLSEAINAVFERDAALCVGHNQPYPVNDESHYTIPVHGERRGIPHTMVEICNDLVADKAGQAAWAARLADVLHEAAAMCGLEAGLADKLAG